METDIERMYRAGRVDMPAAGARLRSSVIGLGQHINALNTFSALAGDPPILRAMLQVGGDVHDVLAKAADTTYDAALAVIATADDFVRTDEKAQADYSRITQRVRDTPNPVPPPDIPPVGDPETPGASGVETTPEPKSPEQDRGERDLGIEDPTGHGRSS